MSPRNPVTGIADFLSAAMSEFRNIRERGLPEDALDEVIKKGLARFHIVYACSNQQILDDLHTCNLLPKATEQWRNVSKDGEWFRNIGSSERFVETLNRATWLDIRVYLIAQQMFPETLVAPLANDSELLAELGGRFGAPFQV